MNTTCPRCQEPFNIASDYAENFVFCPNCGDSIGIERTEPAQPIPPTQPPPIPQPQRSGGSVFGIICCSIIGCGLVLFGCADDLSAETSMHQIYASIRYCTGFLLIGIAFQISATNRR